jgi:predicted dehydrogenase
MKHYKDTPSNQNSRRDFLKQASFIGAGFFILPRHVLGGKNFIAPSDKITIAAIGAGGMGYHDIKGVSDSLKADIAFLCDVDDNRAQKARDQWPQAKYYKDWRQMFDKEKDNFDAVIISTPDHNHAAPALAAMQLGKHIYLQKPLTHDIYESRVLTQAAGYYKVVTQMGNQGASGDGVRRLAEYYTYKLIGNVSEVYCWTNRPIWPQGIPWPKDKAQVPQGLDWNLWLGTAPYRDYVDGIAPFNWRAWWDYGTGALGDMGCHIMDVPYNVLGLNKVLKVEASVGTYEDDKMIPGKFQDSYPPSSHIKMTFAKGDNTDGPVTVHWMDGGVMPERPEELNAGEIIGTEDGGALFIGSTGKMMCGTYGEFPNLLPTLLTQQYQVNPMLERVPRGARGHYNQWVQACMDGYGSGQVSSPFSKAGPLTEALLIGNLAVKAASMSGATATIDWDHDNMKVTNKPELNQFVKREYRYGYSLDFTLQKATVNE